MTYQVVNGSIPATVERFLRERIDVVYGLFGTSSWALLVRSAHHDGRTLNETLYFDWPHDRPPTLQEAIEAAVGQE